MNGRTAKLIRSVANTNPYKTENFDDKTKYVYHNNGRTWLLAPGKRLTIKTLKRFYKQGFFTTEILRNELKDVTG